MLHLRETSSTRITLSNLYKVIYRLQDLLRESFCEKTIKPQDFFGLYGQVNKRIRWMPWQQEAMKDVVACDKPRGVGKQTLIRGFPNGETHPVIQSHCD